MSLRDEVRRLEKAARDKNKDALKDWIIQYQAQVYEECERQYASELIDQYNIFFYTMIHALYFSEETLINDKYALNEFICDFMASFDELQNPKGFTFKDFLAQLKEHDIEVTDIDYIDLYKKVYPELDSELSRYLVRRNHRKIILILAEPDIMKDEIELLKTLSEKAKIVFIDSYLDYNNDLSKPSQPVIDVYNKADEEKIVICDEVYILSSDDNISSRLKTLEEYAIKHNKKVIHKKVSELYE